LFYCQDCVDSGAADPAVIPPKLVTIGALCPPVAEAGVKVGLEDAELVKVGLSKGGFANGGLEKGGFEKVGSKEMALEKVWFES
jgi:hypothetical protein